MSDRDVEIVRLARERLTYGEIAKLVGASVWVVGEVVRRALGNRKSGASRPRLTADEIARAVVALKAEQW